MITEVEWDEANEEHSTTHGVSCDEIDQALRNGPTIRPNRKDRSGNVRAESETDGGRRVVVIGKYDSQSGKFRPITAWEDDQ